MRSVARRPTIFAGYLNRPDATQAALGPDGFFHTGDIAALTPAGEVRIVGRRATDLIKTGGYKVGAGEVEAALLEHPAVREAAVVGAPDEDLGERIVGRRATDLIKTGGYKVGAGEVEAALLEHPAVREAAVVGVADEDLGERIVAFVVPYPGAVPPAPEALGEHVARLLAPHKRPRAVRIVEALPRNAMGKVLKKQLAGMV